MDVVHVIVPAYNSEEYIERCVISILSQRNVELDVIIVDDGSTDSTGILCDRLASQDSRIRVIHKMNEGVSAARNSALCLIHDGYVLCVDSDDYLLTDNAIHDCIDNMEANRSDMVFFSYSQGSDEAHAEKHLVVSSPVTLPKNTVFEQIISDNILSYPWHFIAKSFLYDNISFPEGRVAEDLGTVYKIVLNANRITLIPSVYYFYFARNNSIVHWNNSSKAIHYYDNEIMSYREIRSLCKTIGNKFFVLSCNAFLRQFIAHYGLEVHNSAQQHLYALIFDELKSIPFSVINNKNRFHLLLMRLHLFRFMFKINYMLKNK